MKDRVAEKRRFTLLTALGYFICVPIFIFAAYRVYEASSTGQAAPICFGAIGGAFWAALWAVLVTIVSRTYRKYFTRF